MNLFVSSDFASIYLEPNAIKVPGKLVSNKSNMYNATKITECLPLGAGGL